MKTYHAATMDELHNDMCDSLIYAKKEDLHLITTVDTHYHDIMAKADSMAWDFDLKTLWLTPSRWSMMVKQYIDPDQFEAFLDQCTTRIGSKNRGIAMMRTNVVKPRGGEFSGSNNKVARQWGSCMLSIGYKALPTPTITLQSRTSYLGYIGALDLTVAWMVGRYLAEAIGIKVEDMSFVWMNSNIQWHNFKSLAFMLCHPDEKRRRRYRKLLMATEEELGERVMAYINSRPTIRLSRKWLQKVIEEDKAGRTYGDMTYNTFRRIVRRFHTEVYSYEYAQEFEGWEYHRKGAKEGEQKAFHKAYKPLKSVKASTLDFSAIGMPLTTVGS